MKAIETVTVFNKSTGEFYLLKCGSCGLPLYQLVFFGISFHYCLTCHKAKGIVLFKN